MARGRYPARLKTVSPDHLSAKKYLYLWNNADLFQHPEQFLRINSRHLFDNDRPLKMDVGCGTGEFICDVASAHPEHNFVGIDVGFKPIYRAVEIASAMALENIRFIRADFKLLYPLIDPCSLDEVYFHFPIPICKVRQRKHLIFSTVFLNSMFVALTANGRISIMSDDETYFREMLDIAEKDSRFAVAVKNYDDEQTMDEIKSYYHTLWENRGCRILRFELSRNSEQDRNRGT